MSENQSQNQMEPLSEPRTVTTALAVPAAVASMAAQSKAEIEAAYVMARQNRRNIDMVLMSLKESCKRPRFAKVAKYAKPVGGNQVVVGPSIRFAEEAIRAMGNIRIQSMVLADDENTRTVRVSVVDLESLAGYSKDIVIAKTVERNFLKPGMIEISHRENSQGKKTYLVRATESDLSNKIAAEESKIIRNCGLRLVPRDIIDEAMEQVDKTNQDEGAQAPDETRRKLMDAFAQLGVTPKDLEGYLGYPIRQLTAPGIQHLREIFQTIVDGEAQWSDYVAVKQPEKGTVTTDILDGIKPGDVSTHKPPSAPPTEPPKAEAPKPAEPAVQTTPDATARPAKPKAEKKSTTKASAEQPKPEPVPEKPATEAQKPVETPAPTPAPEPAAADAATEQGEQPATSEVTIKIARVAELKSTKGSRYKVVAEDGDAFYTHDKDMAVGLVSVMKEKQPVTIQFKPDGLDAMILKIVA